MRFLLLLVALGLPATAMAIQGIPVLRTTVSASAGHEYLAVDKPHDEDLSDRGPLSSAVDAAWSGAEGSGVGSAKSVADFGKLGVRVSGQWLGGTGIGGGTASASFEDLWTIDAPGLTGTTGSARVSVSVDGLRQSDMPYTLVHVLMGYECLAGGAGCRLDFSEGGGTQTFGFPVPFKFGETFQFVLTMNGSTSASRFYPTSLIDFLQTANVSGLDVRDASGAPVTQFTMSARSGHDYGLASVPEPRTWALLAAGLGLMGMVARRQASRSPQG